MERASEVTYNINSYIGPDGVRTIKDVISFIYSVYMISEFPFNIFVSVDNNEPNDFDAIKDSEYYDEYIVTGSYVDKNSSVIIYAISQEDYENGCKE